MGNKGNKGLKNYARYTGSTTAKPYSFSLYGVSQVAQGEEKPLTWQMQKG